MAESITTYEEASAFVLPWEQWEIEPKQSLLFGRYRPDFLNATEEGNGWFK